MYYVSFSLVPQIIYKHVKIRCTKNLHLDFGCHLRNCLEQVSHQPVVGDLK